MNLQPKVKLSINVIDNKKSNIICSMCRRPICLNEIDSIINSNYNQAPECFKIHTKNEFINVYNKIDNLTLRNNSFKLNIKPWDYIKSSPTYFNDMNTIINNLIIDEKNNYTDIDEENFRNDFINKYKDEYNKFNLKNKQHHNHDHNHDDNDHQHNHEHNH
tara:strand:- start:166 stop:648 length:483 start_codon:yes stop_codon:yes gene_type:complete